MDAPKKEFTLAGSLEELKAKGRLVVHGSHRPILVICDRGRIFALDNRCPHMGFPLEQEAHVRATIVKSEHAPAVVDHKDWTMAAVQNEPPLRL